MTMFALIERAVWAGYGSPFALLVHCLELRRRLAMRFEHVVYAGRDSVNCLCDTWRASFLWHLTEGTHLKGLNAASVLDAILNEMLKASFWPDRAEEALSSAGEVVVAPSMEVFGGFWFRMARAAREPCEDDGSSARRFWHASASSSSRETSYPVLSLRV
ncbi:hypothetical protein Taro_041229 [Colocasia esculenta]|uniref:Uncharacterized protein n=1 Tax=Colocasia esculenta TaxID=4460 RepID=A0A843WV88_COLES|nr:hypothetical protein [Colocasia esculenta]